MSNKLLFDTQPLVILPELAVAIGLNEAVVLQQVHYWCELNKKAGRNHKDGHYWVYNSFPAWQKQFPWWSERTIKTIFSKLEKRNLLVSGTYNDLSMDRTKWYRVNHDTLDALIASPSCKNCPMDGANVARPIPEISTERKNGKKEKGNFSTDCPKDIPSKNPINVSVPIVELPNEEISCFIDWYFARYMEYYGAPHPNIKSKQRIRVTETLEAFIGENGLDVEYLQEMIYAFFDNVEYTDHNINHFATNGILENRYYEAVY